jgi:ABC-type uncharacterized transport system fused permease/ATPase subunit
MRLKVIYSNETVLPKLEEEICKFLKRKGFSLISLSHSSSLDNIATHELEFEDFTKTRFEPVKLTQV